MSEKIELLTKNIDNVIRGLVEIKAELYNMAGALDIGVNAIGVRKFIELVEGIK